MLAKRQRRTAVTVAAVALVAVSCGGDGVPSSTISADVDEIMAAAADAMGGVDSVRFSIERGGAPVFIDLGAALGDLLEFKGAEGRFTKPASADALVTVNAGGFNTQVGALAIDGQIWLSFLGGGWQPAPPSYQFDPASLFDPDQGFRQLFVDGLQDVTLIGEEERGGVATYHITGTAGEERVEVITARLVTGQAVVLEAWIDRSTGELVDAFFTTEVSDGTATWALTFREYGEDVTIEAPDLEAGG